MLVVLAIPVLALFVAAAVAAIEASHIQGVRQEFSQSVMVHSQLNGLQTLLTNNETGAHGYATTGDERLLALSQAAERQIPETLTRLGQLLAEDPDQTNRLARLRTLVDRRARISRDMAAVRPGAQQSEQLRHFGAEGRLATEQIQVELTALHATEEEAIRVASVTPDRTLLIALTVLGLGILGSGAAALLFTGSILRRFDALAANVARVGQGDGLLVADSGRDEIGRLTASLAGTANLLAEQRGDLGRASAFLEHLIDSGPTIIFAGSLDPDPTGGYVPHMTYVSPNVRRLLGVPSDVDLSVPNRWLDRLHPDDAARVLRRATDGLADDVDRISQEVRILHADGSYRSFEAVVDLRDRTRVLGYAVDINDRKLAEVAVRQSEARFQAILEHSPAIIYVRDTDHRYLLLSNSGVQVVGRPIEDVLGRTVFDLFGERATRLVENDRRVITEGRALMFDERVEHADGIHRYVSVKFPLLDDQGEPYAVCGISTDVTQRNRDADALAERERLLRAIVDSSPDVIAMLGLDNEVLSTSPAITTALGYEPDELVGTQFRHLIHPDDLADAESDFGRLVAGQQDRLHNRFRLRHKNGSWIVADGRGQAMVDSDGLPTGMVGVLRDATAQVQLEAELREASETAVEASRAKSEFLSRMSHELRTPLNSVLGFAQLLELSELDEVQADNLGYILGAGRHLLDLINEVLDISRIEAGRLPLSIEPVEAADVISAAAELMRPQSEDAGIHLRPPDPQAAPVWIRADRQRLLQVLLNLLSNAVKYNEPGGEVELGCVTTSTGEVELSVRDSGAGIPEENLVAIFEPFERLDAESSGIEGTGVGLALARALTEGMGGTLTVSSRMGQGTTFVVRLPQSHTPEGRVSAPVTQTPMPDEPDEDAFRVLYIEDNPANLELIRRALMPLPAFELLSATLGQQGLELAQQQQPDAVLLDLNLPDIEGADVLDQLRESPEMADVPVLIISADATPAQIRRLRAQGADDYLTKPINIEELVGVLGRFRASGRSPAGNCG